MKGGFRVVLTYNLVLDRGSAASAPRLPARSLDGLTQHVQTYFETPIERPWRSSSPGELPDRLVYLLDHQYTQKGLGWQRLKGADAERAVALRDVAERLDCEVQLALADVHETWSCEDEEGYGYGRRKRWSSRNDDDEEDDDAEGDAGGDADGHVLIELCDSDIELRHAVDASGKSVTPVARVDRNEVCFTKASVDLEPFQSEHEGYQGNWGNTVDRWYHRAAVVLWPRERTFVLRAKESPAWALAELAKVLEAGELQTARRMAERLLPFWSGRVSAQAGGPFTTETLEVAGALDAPELAAALLGPLKLEHLLAAAAPRCAVLVRRYGLAWFRALVEQWGRGHAGPERGAFTKRLPAFCRALASSADELEAARVLVQGELKWVAEAHASHCGWLPSKTGQKALVELHAPILGLLEACDIAQSPKLHRQVLDLIAAERGALVTGALRLLRLARDQYEPSELDRLGLLRVWEQCREELAARLAKGPRSASDWSIEPPARCGCELCRELAKFLRAKDRVELAWPLSKERRRHVHNVLDGHDLPVRHETERTGRPYSLVLRKTPALFERAAAERKAWEKDLQWLEQKVDAIRERKGGRR